MSTWNAAFEATPAGSDSPAQGDDRIRELKADVRLRLAKEHTTYVSGSASGTEAEDGWHRAGSAMIYVAASAPTTRPDGSTALTAADDGRLWYDTANAVLKYYAHPSWTTVPAVIGANSVTNAGLADMAQATIKGRASGAGTGDPVDLTAAQVRTIINSVDFANGVNTEVTFQTIANGATWTPPAGLYMFASFNGGGSSAFQFQIYYATGGTWEGNTYSDGGGGLYLVDGANYRFFNNTGSNRTLYYKKLL